MTERHCAYCERRLSDRVWPAKFEADDGSTTCASSPTGHHEPAGGL